MTIERLKEIFENKNPNWEGDNAFQGLQILSKYSDKLITAAEHDIIFSCAYDDVIENLTEEDALSLAQLNWMLEYDSFACFV